MHAAPWPSPSFPRNFSYRHVWKTQAGANSLFLSLCLSLPRTLLERAKRENEREIERDFYFLKVHLGDSIRHSQSSRENLE